jgi:PAS domain S-box-containing protein
MVTISRDGKITDVNKATEEVTGVSRERLIGTDFSNYFSEPDKAREGYKKVLSEGLVKDYELTIQHVSGRKKQVLYNASVYRDEAGEVQGIYAATRDVTELKKAKETLYHNEERFRRIFQEGLLGVALSNMNHTFAMANARFCNMFGYSVEELRAMTFKDITLPEDISSDAPYLQKLITGALKYYSTEKRYLTKNKDIIWGSLTVTLLRDNSGEPQGFLSTVEDITQHKKMEEKLADSETRYRRLFETAQDAILILNGDTGKIIDANPFIKALLGYSMEELVDKNLWEIGELKDTLASKISNQQLQENGYVRYDHLPLLTKDGRQIAVEVVANAYQVNHSRVIQCNIRDITERKKMEESIRYHASLIENVSDAIISSDQQQKLLSWNKAAEAMYGWRAEEVIGKNVNEVVKPVFQNFTREEYRASLRQNGHWKGEAIHHRKDGAEFNVLMSVSLIRDERGNETGAVSIFKDITESKQADERINHLKLTLRSIRNVNKHLTKEKNRDRLIQGVCDSLVESHSFNSAWIILLDDTQKPIAWAAANPGNNFSSLIESVQRGDFPRCVQKALHQKQVVITENPGTMCPGCPILAGGNENGSMTIRLEIDGTVYGVLCASMQRSLLSDKDETALFAEVAADLAFALRNIELGSAYEIMEQERLRTAKLESIGTLAGGIAHDFNNLLTGIMGNIGLAKISIQPPNPVLEMLEEAEKAAVRARDLTQQLLTFARGGKPVKKLVNIGVLIKESAEFSLRGSNVKLELALPEDLWSVEADEGQIGQVINNLVINADEAMPSGGTLRILASNLGVERARGLPFPRNNYVLIDIMDSGKGIPQEYLPRIFEPYFTTKQRGSGLGLTTAYSIVRNHGGYIFAESQPDKGSTFHIYLPASKKAVKGGRKMTTTNLGQAGGKVLVMDDEEIIRKMLENMLNLAGYRVELSSGGKEAIQKYGQAITAGDPFDAVIMDLTIPGGTGGKEAVKELLKIDPRAAVIVSSGYANDPIMAEYKKHGFKAVIAKPYSVKQLQETLSGLPRRKNLTPR